jgi:predicted esterase
MLRPALTLLALLAVAAVAEAAPTGWLPEQSFDTYSPLAATKERVQRLLAPTYAERLRSHQQRTGAELAEHSLDLANERFDLYVPATMPAQGYGLLVFVAPSADFPLPRDWRQVLDRRGVIYVSARRAGNQQSVIDRRVPLALHAHQHVAAHYAVDPQRVWISGFSGGSRVAQRIAVAYPDLFRGAVLMAGSDAFGEFDSRPSRAPLFTLFRERSRVVFVSGDQDYPNKLKDKHTIASFQRLCVSNFKRVWLTRSGHWVPDARRLERVFEFLDQPGAVASTDPDCASRVQASIDAGLQQVERLMTAQHWRQAGELLGALEDQYGGLLAPRSVELAPTIAAHLPMEEPDATP